MTEEADKQDHPVRKLCKELSLDLLSVTAKAKEAIRDIKRIDLRDEFAGFKVFMILFLCKGIDICHSTAAILEYHPTLWRVAQAVIRSLWEIYTDARYMSMDPVALSERYERYNVVTRYRFKKDICDLSDDLRRHLEGLVEESAILKKEYENFVQKYQIKMRLELNSWSGKSRKQMLIEIQKKGEDIGLLMAIYKFQCAYLHNDIKYLRELIEPKAGSVSIDRTVDSSEVERTFVTAIILFVGLFALFDDALGSACEEWIEGFLGSFKKKWCNGK